MDSEKQIESFGREGAGGWVNLVVGIKEGTYCMEHWVWCINNDSWNTEKIKFEKKNKVSEDVRICESDHVIEANHWFGVLRISYENFN